MPRLVTRAVRLLKFGAVAGALVGVGRLVMKRRRQAEMDESSWPTIAHTAAQNGQPVDEEADADDADADDADAGSDDAGSDEAAGGDAEDDS